jgi:hypothetical protein
MTPTVFSRASLATLVTYQAIVWETS